MKIKQTNNNSQISVDLKVKISKMRIQFQGVTQTNGFEQFSQTQKGD